MSRAKRVFGATAALSAAGLFASCGAVTQIELDVRTNTCAKEPTTEIVLGRTLDDAEKAGKRAATRTGCVANGQVGTLTIVPREGSTGGVVAIRVTASFPGVESCAATPEKCIVSRALAQFERGKTVRATVFLDDVCVGVQCGPAATCRGGRCVDVNAPPDADGGAIDDAGPPKDASTDASADASSDANDPLCRACEQLAGPGVTAACLSRAPLDAGAPAPGGGAEATTCVIGVTGKNRNAQINCPPGLPCFVTCTDEGACQSVTCAANVPSCEITCNGVDDGVSVCNALCQSPRCRVRCTSNANCTVRTIDSDDAFIDCSPSGGQSCRQVSCKPKAAAAPLDCKLRASNNCTSAPCICTEGTDDCNDNQ